LDILHNELVALNLLDEVVQVIYLEIEKILIYKIVPEFWQTFKEFKDDTNINAVEKCAFQMFRQAVGQLYQKYRLFYKTLERVKYLEEKSGNKFSFKFDEIFKSCLLSQLPSHFSNIVHGFYHVSFKVFLNTKGIDDEEDDYMEERVDCYACDLPTARCQCQELVNGFTETNLCLNRMGLLDRLSGFTLTNLIQDQVAKHINDKCRGNFDSPHLESLKLWLNEIVVEWLTRIYNNGSSKVDPANTKICDSINYFKVKLEHFLHEKYANTIIDQFFNIIIEFPDSQPAIDDLKQCMEKLDLRAHLVETLKNSIETRLLHPGVDTSDIITGYVATIKTMRHLEKSGILLQTVTEPVKEYLRKGRQDTVRCVITSLIEETPSDLSEELARSEAIKAEETERNLDELNNWESWNPDPIDADPEKHSPQNRKNDIISMIVDIYGSKELFVNEYRNLLAERLLTQLDFSSEKEFRNLELLKLRFGENLLHSCEVMLKDISDSKRINSYIQGAAFGEGKLKLHLTIKTSQI
jgi:anaphase-promoting complex subunit 2